ncbi:MAG: cupin domain-containing protein [Bacteroidetes bacterium]|nr:cupin domain-containing protein [Bacteroidota bacterium]
MRKNAAYWIEHLQLHKHVEGGYFKEYYRSDLLVPQQSLPSSFKGDRSASTSIYFLLERNQFSALHRIAADELWHFYAGDCLIIFELLSDGGIQEHRLGNDPEKGEELQVVIRAGNWFGSMLDNGGEYALVGCTVAPGFDFADFELAERTSLIQQYPQHSDVIRSLTRLSG